MERGIKLKRYVFLVFVIGLIVAVSGCTMSGWGSGNLTNQTKEVNGVNQVLLNGIGTIILQQGDQESLTIEAEDNILPHIQSKVEGNKLIISYDTNTPTPTKDVKFYLTVKDMTSIGISGAGKIQSTGFNTKTMSITMDGAGDGNLAGLTLEKLTVNISGAGKMIMAGKATEQTVTISGAGNYEANDLATEITTINVDGAGKGTVNVSKVLNAMINGAGNLNYLGSPQVNQQINGGGSVKQVTN